MALAQRLKWPISYIPDLIRGRKKLTLARAIAFARRYRLDPISLEKLILLAVRDSGLLEKNESALLDAQKTRRRHPPTEDMVAKRGVSFTVSSEPLYTDDRGQVNDSAMHTRFASLFASFFRNAPLFGPALYNSAFVHLDVSRFEEVAEKIVALRNWILEISRIDEAVTLDRDVRLFQLDFNLTPICHKKTAQGLRW